MDAKEGHERTMDSTALSEENAALREKVNAFEKLQQELMAEEIFEKAKKRFKSWLTVGGLAALLAGVLGFKSIEGYVEGLAKKRMGKITDSVIEQKVQSHAKARVDALMEKEKDQLIAISRQEVMSIVARLPIAAIQPEHASSAAVALDITRSVADISEFMTPVRDQGTESSTVGFATAAAMEGLLARKTNKRIVLSSRYLYNAARAVQGLKGDSGAFIKDAVHVLKTQGAVLESVWPYKPGEADSKPPAAVEGAERFRVKAAREIRSLPEIKAALQGGVPVIGGITLFQSSMRDSSGVIPDPTSKDTLMGGHAVCIVGYDDAKKLLKVKNSWSKSWGDAGYGYISYSYAEKNLTEAWVLEL